MRKEQELTDPASCTNRALPGERLFTLMGRDETVPDLIEEWARRRIKLGKNTRYDRQIVEALACAEEMRTEFEGVRDRLKQVPYEGYKGV